MCVGSLMGKVWGVGVCVWGGIGGVGYEEKLKGMLAYRQTPQ